MRLFIKSRSLFLSISMLLCPCVAAFGQQLYWSDFIGSSVGHVGLDGTGSVVIDRLYAPLGMDTVDSSGQVYWLEYGGSVITSDPDLSNPHTLAAFNWRRRAEPGD